MHPVSSSTPGKRGPNRQLLAAPTHVSTFQQDHSPRRTSAVVWRTYVVIAGLVLLGAARAAVAPTAVKGFSVCDAADAPD